MVSPHRFVEGSDMATVRELTTKWGFEVNDKPLHDLQNTLKATSFSIAGVVASVGAAGAALFGITKITADAGEEALKLSKKTGIGIEALQKLGHAAHMADLDHAQFATSLKFLNKNIFEASQSQGDSAEAFRRMGISLRGAGGQLRKADDVLLSLSDRFKALPDGPQKTAMAMKIFGRAGNDMIPLLNEGSARIREMGIEAEELGLIFSEDAAKAANEMNDNLKRAQGAIKGLTYALGNQLIPVVSELLNEFVEFVKLNKKDLLEGLTATVGVLADYVKIAWKFFKALFKSAMGFVELFGGFKKVADVVGKLAGILAGGVVLSAIGALTVATWGWVAGLTAANVAAFAIPIAIGAAVALIGLIIEDIATFFAGGDSFFGDFVKTLQEDFPNAFKFIKGVLDTVIVQFKIMWELIKLISSGIMTAFSAVADFLGKVFGPIIDKLGSFLGPLIGKIGGALSQSAAIQNQGLQAIQNRNNQNISVNAPINVQAGGLPPGQAVKAVETGVSGGMGGLLRGADRAFAGGATY